MMCDKHAKFKPHVDNSSESLVSIRWKPQWLASTQVGQLKPWSNGFLHNRPLLVMDESSSTWKLLLWQLWAWKAWCSANIFYLQNVRRQRDRLKKEVGEEITADNIVAVMLKDEENWRFEERFIINLMKGVQLRYLWYQTNETIKNGAG